MILYRNNQKNRNFGKKAPQNVDSEQATIAERQGASENQNSEAKPTQPKTDSSSCFGMPWTHTTTPLYDILKSYADNVEHGPQFAGPLPKRILPPKEKWISFLGFPVASPIGVPAGPLLTSSWVSLAAALGFDLPVYKTIRSLSFPSHPLPNVVHVHLEESKAVLKEEAAPLSLYDLGITNSFGMPSQSPEFLIEDIAKANASLSEGQVMIVSIVGTEREGISLLEDFVQTAKLAKQAGAKIVEANFSCPNVSCKAGALYTDPDAVYAITSALTKALGNIPLILKVGVFSSKEQMRSIMIAAAKGGARGFSGINTISRKVVTSAGEPALGTRLQSGICGSPIKKNALEFIQQAYTINREEKLELTLIGVGGITLPEHFTQFFEKGADVAMSATGMMWDPYLAARYHHIQETS